jgi:predicted amidophosphoribosyltransferase
VTKPVPKAQRRLSSDLPVEATVDPTAVDTDSLDCPSGRDMECTGCGTLIGFVTDRCPICGTMIGFHDLGIVSLFADMQFDGEISAEMDCPACGERVKLAGGRCPACGELVRPDDAADPDKNVEPLIQDGNVVYMHLDVETGELSCLQRLARKLGFERLTFRLNCGVQGGTERENGAKTASNT